MFLALKQLNFSKSVTGLAGAFQHMHMGGKA